MPKDQAQADNEETLVEDQIDTSNDPISGATDLAAYEAALGELDDSKEDHIERPTAKDATLPKDEEDEPEEQSEDAGNGEEESEVEESEEQSEEETAEEEEPVSDDHDEPTDSIGKAQRIKPVDDVEREAFAIKRRHPAMPMEKCLAQAKSILGVTDQQAESGEGKTVVRNAATVETEIVSLIDQKADLEARMEFEEAAAIGKQISLAQLELNKLAVKESQQKLTDEQQEALAEEREFDGKYNASKAKAVQFYPDASKKDSALTLKMIEIDNQLKAVGDPIFDSPEKPFILAKEAAKRLGIIMADPSSKPAATKKNAPSRPNPLASGNARTTDPTATTAKVGQAIEALETVLDYDKFVAGIS